MLHPFVCIYLYASLTDLRISITISVYVYMYVSAKDYNFDNVKLISCYNVLNVKRNKLSTCVKLHNLELPQQLYSVCVCVASVIIAAT